MPFDEENGKDGGGDSERHVRSFADGQNFAAQVIPDVIEILKKEEGICSACFAKGVASTMINYATYMSHGLGDEGDPDPGFVKQIGDVVAHAIHQGFEVHKEWLEEQKGKMQ